MTQQKTIAAAIATIVLSIVLAVATAGMLTQQAIPSSGSVDVSDSASVGGSVVSGSACLGVFSDADGAVSCGSLSWGCVGSGASVSRVVYVKNTGDVPLTLGLSASGWAPSAASDALTLSWDLEGRSLGVGAVVLATIQLTVSQNTGSLGDFCFNIVVSGSA
jgi:hypothetical protein